MSRAVAGYPSGGPTGAGPRIGLIFPVAIIGAVLVILIPIPAGVMDVLLAANFTLAAILLMATISVRTPLELSVFPSILLAVTLLRLVLNVASTRLILTQAGTAGTAAAGRMIQQFGELVTGNRLVVGCVIFAIIVVIQFVVITRGATRISEVAARFALDSLPGRQMAIDADLNAGTIDEATARWQREELSRQADFFGAMDGAAKFVRGDAIAGVIITLVNILGGLYVGVVEAGMSLSQAAGVFTKLTIGDGLASQVPAFLVALAAGLLITRSSTPMQLGEQVVRQLSQHPQALALAGLFAVLLAAGRFPPLPLVVLALLCTALAASAGRRQQRARRLQDSQPAAKQSPAVPIEHFLQIDPVSLELGYGLLYLADDSRGGPLIRRLQQLRQETAERWGLILPKVRIRDNLRLGPRDYLVRIRGRVVGQATVPPDRLLAAEPASPPSAPLGVAADAECFGPHACWVKPDLRVNAQRHGYQILDACGALMLHLRRIVARHAAELLTRDQVKRLLDSLRATAPALVDEVVPGVISVGRIHRVLQRLLAEGRSIRDLETILEALEDCPADSTDVEALTRLVRSRIDSLSPVGAPAVCTAAA